MTTAKCKLSILVQTHHHFISKPLMFAKATVRCVQKRSEALRGERARAPLACWWCELEQGIALAPPHSRAPETTRGPTPAAAGVESWDGKSWFHFPGQIRVSFYCAPSPTLLGGGGGKDSDSPRPRPIRGRRAGATQPPGGGVVVGQPRHGPCRTPSPFHTGRAAIFFSF